MTEIAQCGKIPEAPSAFPFDGAEQYDRKDWQKDIVVPRREIENTYGIHLEMFRHYRPFVLHTPQGIFLVGNHNFEKEGGRTTFDPEYNFYIFFRYIGDPKKAPSATPPDEIMTFRDFNRIIRETTVRRRKRIEHTLREG